MNNIIFNNNNNDHCQVGGNATITYFTNNTDSGKPLSLRF